VEVDMNAREGNQKSCQESFEEGVRGSDFSPEKALPRVLLRSTPERADRGSIEAIARGTGFFNEAEVAIAVELVDDRLTKGDASEYWFLLDGPPGDVTGYTCYGPISGTRSSFDLYWIVVRADAQGRGLGRMLLDATNERIRAMGGTRVYAETSSKPLYEPTRRFYESNGFHADAVLPDFYAPGDSKVIYRRDV
jgi:GNAT superfamily N-acetyltransferase